MAIDEALLAGVASGTSPPTFRLFTWKPPCLSLGFFQHPSNSVLMECRRRKIAVIRRPTGGLAVLHGWDLCYSVTAPLGINPLPPGLQQAVLRINLALRAGLKILGLPAEVALLKERKQEAIACVEATSLYEVVVDGKKIVGSAQLQKNGCLLQHGSLFLDLVPATFSAVFGQATGYKNFANKSICLQQVAGRAVTVAEAAAALQAGFAGELGIVLEQGLLSNIELREVERLCRDKYRDLTAG